MSLRTLTAITQNTFIETIRQPVYGVITVASALLLIFGPSLSMFTLDDDNKLLKDIGISTLLVTGLFLAVFAATMVVTREIERKTVLTVITKPATRGTFIIGKFLGITGAVILSQFLLCLVFIIVVRHGVLQRASDHIDYVTVTFGAIAAALTFIVTLAGNYFYNWKFSSATVISGTFFTIATIIALIFVDPYWRINPAGNNLHPELIKPMILTIIATIIFTALAVAASTRLELVPTLIICIIAFLGGVMLQPILMPVAHNGGIISYLAWAVLAIVPSINTYVVSNAITGGFPVPWYYVAQSALYAVCYVIAVLLFAIALFRSREIS